MPLPTFPVSRWTRSLKSRLIGEAKFLRALNYFHIVNIWGAVPLRTEPNAADNGNLALSDVETVYAKIESDLSDVIASTVPISYSGEDAGRVTQGAAYALRAKVHLFRQNWGACLSDIESLEALHQYEPGRELPGACSSPVRRITRRSSLRRVTSPGRIPDWVIS